MDLGFLKEFEGRHLLVAGEVGIDEYIWGDTRRISPEAPVPVVEVESTNFLLGLSANVAQNIVSLGARTTLISVRGSDDDGQLLSQMIDKAGIQSSILVTDPTRPTLRKVRVLAQKQHVVRIDYEKNHDLDPKLAETFRDILCDKLRDSDGIILQDYGKGIWNPDTVSFIKHAQQLKKPVFVDPSRNSHLGLYRGVTLLSPNLQEAEALCAQTNQLPRSSPQDLSRVKKLGQEILKKTHAENVVITLGPWGMASLSQNESEINHIPTFAREVFDVTGAGDTVIAVLALTRILQLPLSQCMQIANAAAGVVVGHIGAASLTQMELATAIERLKTAGVL